MFNTLGHNNSDKQENTPSPVKGILKNALTTPNLNKKSKSSFLKIKSYKNNVSTTEKTCTINTIYSTDSSSLLFKPPPPQNVHFSQGHEFVSQNSSAHMEQIKKPSIQNTTLRIRQYLYKHLEKKPFKQNRAMQFIVDINLSNLIKKNILEGVNFLENKGNKNELYYWIPQYIILFEQAIIQFFLTDVLRSKENPSTSDVIYYIDCANNKAIRTVLDISDYILQRASKLNNTQVSKEYMIGCAYNFFSELCFCLSKKNNFILESDKDFNNQLDYALLSKNTRLKPDFIEKNWEERFLCNYKVIELSFAKNHPYERIFFQEFFSYLQKDPKIRCRVENNHEYIDKYYEDFLMSESLAAYIIDAKQELSNNIDDKILFKLLGAVYIHAQELTRHHQFFYGGNSLPINEIEEAVTLLIRDISIFQYHMETLHLSKESENKMLCISLSHPEVIMAIEEQTIPPNEKIMTQRLILSINKHIEMKHKELSDFINYFLQSFHLHELISFFKKPAELNNRIKISLIDYWPSKYNKILELLVEKTNINPKSLDITLALNVINNVTALNIDTNKNIKTLYHASMILEDVYVQLTHNIEKGSPNSKNIERHIQAITPLKDKASQFFSRTGLTSAYSDFNRHMQEKEKPSYFKFITSALTFLSGKKHAKIYIDSTLAINSSYPK